MDYKLIRTDTADEGIRKIILSVAQKFGNAVALQKLHEMEEAILRLGQNPYIGIDPRYPVLKRQQYKVLILKKSLVFYKINEKAKIVTIYAVVDQRQDYLSIIRAVSYTHLDVYKRQTQGRIRRCTELLQRSRSSHHTGGDRHHYPRTGKDHC